jgi:hypothetical protein
MNSTKILLTLAVENAIVVFFFFYHGGHFQQEFVISWYWEPKLTPLYQKFHWLSKMPWDFIYGD